MMINADMSGQTNVNLALVYLARYLPDLTAVPDSFWGDDPTIKPDPEITAAIDGVA